MPLAGKKLTPLQVARLCYKHGIDPDAGKGVPLVTAVCVAFAESTYYSGAWNFTNSTGDKSYGLWQINMIGAIGPERRAKYKLKRNEDLYNPDTNCKIMVDMSKKGTKWTPWGAFNSGSYLNAWEEGVKARADLLKELGRPVSKVPVPVSAPVPLEKRSWISFKQLLAASKSRTGVVGGGASKDDVANYQRGLWRLLPGIDYGYRVGTYDDRTKRATREFQRKNGFPITGVPSPALVKVIESRSQLFRARDY